MRILLIHNKYQIPGGEDTVVRQESEMLQSAGHNVKLLYFDNGGINKLGRFGLLLLALRTVFSVSAYRVIKCEIESFRPDLVHFHNTFPLVSPSGYLAAKRRKIPVVQTLHNYRLLCANAMLLRNNRPCELCIKGSMWNAVRYACYRNSRMQTAVVVAMLKFHRAINSWNKWVDAYVVLTKFASKKFRGVLEDARIFIKPNFVDAEHVPTLPPKKQILFVGRLSPEKGVEVLLDAWKKVQNSISDYELVLIGDGPLKEVVTKQARSLQRVNYVGKLGKEDVFRYMKESAFLVFPSLWYEGMSMVLLEAMSSSMPIIATDLGSTPEVVEHGANGLLIEPANANALFEAIVLLCSDSRLRLSMSANALKLYRAKYSPEGSLGRLEEVYKAALGEHSNS